jgi:glycine/D-amino acid oxidase-like deaminating enzyme
MEVCVVGGGIAGCAAAYQLARRGAGVRLFERETVGGQASGRNMGLLLNQTEPGVVALMQRALVFYEQLQYGPVRFDYRRLPQVMFATDDAEMARVRSRAADLAGSGLGLEEITGVELRRRHPFLAATVAGGFLIGDAVAIDPLAATVAFAEAARDGGSQILTGTRVTQVVTAGDRVRGVITDAGRFECDAVVLAGGPWLPDLWRPAPVSAGRGWLLRTGRLPFALDSIVEQMSWPDQDELGRTSRPPTLGDVAAGHERTAAAAFVISPLPTGDGLIGTSLSPSLRDAYEGVGMPRMVAERALAAAPGLRELAITASWYGLRPMTPDGMPMVGRAGPEGLFIHGGHGSIGMMTAPATADWLAELVLGGSPPAELGSLSPARFGD